MALAAVIGLLLLTVAVLQPAPVQTMAQAPPPAGTRHNGKAFRFNRVKDGIYHAIGTGALAVVGNSSIIVNDNDVIVVDDHVSPAAAWVLLDEIKSITDKPVRTVINTHFHFDHAHGNQVFGRDVDIIGHEFTRDMLLKGNPLQMPLYKNYVDGLPGQIDDLRKRVAAAADATARAALQVQLDAAENNRASQAELRPTPPNVTLRTEMSLYRGNREIQIRFLGRAHTGGDIVVYLPKEKAVITGDFLTAALSNMSDAFVNEWPATLDELKKLDFDTVLPGHGEAFTDKAKIDYFQAYLRDVWTQVSRFKQQGVPAEDAAKRADLTKHKEHFPTIQGPGVPIIAVTRIYELLDRATAR
jgi:glyoxylase-like metal-dependent hydrolase (beta-lactamase superfamily II)